MKKKVYKPVLCILLALLCFCYQPILIYAFDTEHGGAGGKHEIGETSYEGDYTVTDFLEDVSYGAIEFGKFVILIGSTTWGLVSGGLGYKDIVEGFAAYNDNINTGKWIHVDANNNVTYDQELIDLLKQFLTEYAQQHPEEVEKINYRIIHTISYEEAFANYINYRTTLEGEISVPKGYNSMEHFRDLWNTQTEYIDFPRMILLPTYPRKLTPEDVKSVYATQSFSFFEGYEKGKNMCLVGEFGGNNWGGPSEYHIGVYTYDPVTGALAIDRRMGGVDQRCNFVWDEENNIWNGSEAEYYVLNGSSNAYINMSGGFWGGGWGYFAQKNDPEFAKRYEAVYNADSSVTIPMLATPNGSSFRLFATEQDAMRYFEICKESGLNFDPAQVYTEGSVTINNNGDVTINNTPSGDENDPPTDNSQILEMMYNRLGEILTQVAKINQFSSADTVINAIDSYEGGISQITDELVDSISQVFPFCILWDFVRIVKIFEAEPLLPVFEIPIKFVWIDETIAIDLTEYEALFTLLRTGEIILFLLGLFNLTMTWVGKGDEII